MKTFAFLAMAVLALPAFADVDPEHKKHGERGQGHRHHDRAKPVEEKNDQSYGQGQSQDQSQGQSYGQEQSYGQSQDQAQGQQYYGEQSQGQGQMQYRGRGEEPADYTSWTMTCADAMNLVQAEGAVRMMYGEGVYDRFVRDGAYCAPNEGLRPAYVPTLDHESCMAGYVCDAGYSRHSRGQSRGK